MRQAKQEIEQLIRDYQNRGEITRQQFCESRGMTLSRLDYYLRRYGKPTPPPQSPQFAAVRLTPAAIQIAGSFRLVLSNGRCIECGPAELEHLIRIAETV